MKKSLVVLSLWIGISLMGMEAAYRRGVEAMLEKANGGHGVWSAEYGVGVLRRHGGAAGEAAADYITDDVDEDGLWNAFKRLGRI